MCIKSDIAQHLQIKFNQTKFIKKNRLKTCQTQK